jgi:hypothetical protein
MLVRQPASSYAFAPFRVAIMSGLSDPATCALSSVQRDFLARLQVPASSIVPRNFPYVACQESRPVPPLWKASWNNFAAFRRASTSGYIEHARRHWRALRDSCESLLVITLSCGHEILRNVVDREDEQRRIEVLALGPVARRFPPFRTTVAIGSRDPIARFFTRSRTSELHSVVPLPGLGHLDYFRSDAVLHLANELLCSSTFRSSAADSISRNAS